MTQIKHPFIWNEADSSARHQYRNFRYCFGLDESVEHAELHLFADTRYRLSVNGRLVDHGPCRFKVGFPKYDTHEITDFLNPGENVITITVCSYAWETFFTDDSVGGLVAWGDVKTAFGSVSISTSSGWKVSTDTGYLSETGIMSFALGMQESQDTRLEPAGWLSPDFDDSGWPDAVPVADQDHWGALEPRTIPKLSEIADREPHHVLAYDSAPLAETVYSTNFVTKVSQNMANSRVDVRLLTTAMALNLHADEACITQLATLPGLLFLNGTELVPDESDENACRAVYTVSLEAGDHILVVGISVIFGFQAWSIGWPNKTSLKLATLPGSTEQTACLPYSKRTVEEQCADLIALKNGYTNLEPVNLSLDAQSTPTQRGWRTLSRKGPDAGFPLKSGMLTPEQQRVWSMDFVRELHGRIQIDFEAPAGAVLIFTASERLMPDGTVSSGFQNTCIHHRIVARGGRQQWLAMHPTGFRYLELMVEAEAGEVVVHDLRLSRFQPYEETGRFLCSDAGLNQVWQLCRETQVASIEDAYIDCPWRERGLYTGDQIIQYYLNLALFGDHSMMRHCTELFYQTQDDSGLLAPCSHALKNYRHPDYSALSLESLWHYWSCSGDTVFVQEKAKGFEALARGLEALIDPLTGLVDASGMEPYIARCQIDRNGISLGVNAFICGGFLWASKLFAVVGNSDASKLWKEKYAVYRETIRATFWDSEQQLFRDRRLEDVAEPHPSAFGNTLALYYDLIDGEEAQNCLRFISKCAQNNLVVEHPKQSTDFHFSGYASFYVLALFYKYDEIKIAEQYMRKEWRRMLDGGAWTCWEYFVPSHSHCHAWSASPGWYMSAYIMGLRYAEPGNPDKLIFDPKPGTVEWAEGAFPHPRGAIRVSWKQVGGKLIATLIAPDGVEVDCGDLAVDVLTAPATQHRNTRRGLHDRTLFAI